MGRPSESQLARISRLLDEALTLDEEGRRAWLKRLPPADADIAESLRKSLLPDDDADLTFLNNGPTAEFMSGLKPGALIGPYELIRPLGAGGMAEVWLARRADGAFRRDVALKLPMLTRLRKDLEARFFRERDILASLEHRNIARLYDAGIDAHGLPYLSMEYVQGQQFTVWCDMQSLGIRARLELFLQVLDAVQFAHDRHVIHRDLKPSNILVTQSHEVRLLDFGVAKLLQTDGAEQTQITSLYGRALTPIYASPEVLRGEPVDARTDIYSLGVLLYEILTGGRPYRLQGGASPLVHAQLIETIDVKKPSTQLEPDGGPLCTMSREQVARHLRGDLDAIVLKALAKDRAERFASCAEFAADIRRHLDGAAVRARAPGLAYRLRKFVRRNQAATAVAGIAALALGAMLGYTVHTESASRKLAAAGAAAAGAKSIAVLPFLDLSEAKDQEYFSDGLSEELIGRLAQIHDLQVIARTSSFYFKGKQVATSVIARDLGVAHLLEGSVRRSGHTVRVTAQLLRADSGVQLWSQSYEREVTDIFRVQDDIAAAVVSALKLQLVPDQPVVDPYRSDNPEAYNQFLLGRQLGRRGNIADFKRAVLAYRKATVLDPGYAAAYAGISFNETKIANSTQDAPGFERGLEAAEKALALAPQLVDGYRARASSRLETLDFAGARADWERALALAPGDSMVQGLHGVGLALFGRIADATAAMNKAVELDPLNSYAWANLGIFLTVGGDYAAARRALDRALAINPDDYASNAAMAQLDLLEGRLDDAAAAYDKTGSAAVRLMGTALIEHARKHAAPARQALAQLIDKYTSDMAYQIAGVFAWRGERDKAFEWLEKAYSMRDSGLNGINYDPLLSGLKNDGRFTALVRKLNLLE